MITTTTPPVSTPTTPATTSSSSTSSTSAQPGGDLGEDAFMKLLVAQMQNQDPTSPMDGDQMAAELAQFSSLEQLQQINTTLTGQSTSQGALLGAIQGTSAIGMIGHTVMASGNQVQVGGTNGQSSVTADFSVPAASATLNIVNSSGAVVGSETLGAVTAGRNTFNISDATKGLPDGTYTYSINATDSTGNAVAVTPYMSGVVDGISTGQNGLVLTSGGMSIPYSSVIQISK